MPMQGMLLVNKPKGWTSFDVVNYLRRIVAISEGVKPKSVKVGHTGTLDPIATGLLLILIGKKYTTLAEGLTKKDKIYTVEAVLGLTSPSFDSETDLVKISDDAPVNSEVTNVINSFKGEIDQVPPNFSAIKINGKKAYDLARNGEMFKIDARRVNIKSISDINYEYPKLSFTTEVSSGTYIRSLINDIGLKLNTGAVMTELRRTRIDKYDIADAVTLEGIDAEKIYDSLIRDIE